MLSSCCKLFAKRHGGLFPIRRVFGAGCCSTGKSSASAHFPAARANLISQRGSAENPGGEIPGIPGRMCNPGDTSTSSAPGSCSTRQAIRTSTFRSGGKNPSALADFAPVMDLPMCYGAGAVTHVGGPESNRLLCLRCAALRDPFAWALSIHPSAYVWPLVRRAGLSRFDPLIWLSQGRHPTIQARTLYGARSFAGASSAGLHAHAYSSAIRLEFLCVAATHAVPRRMPGSVLLRRVSPGVRIG